MEDRDVLALCDRVRETAFALHQYLRHGHLEKVYENGLKHRLEKAGIEAKPQYPLQVRDEDGTPLGDYFADLFVQGVLRVELKSCTGIDDSHVAQILGYLRACSVRHGLLINFGAPKLQIKKFVV